MSDVDQAHDKDRSSYSMFPIYPVWSDVSSRRWHNCNAKEQIEQDRADDFLHA